MKFAEDVLDLCADNLCRQLMPDLLSYKKIINKNEKNGKGPKEKGKKAYTLKIKIMFRQKQIEVNSHRDLAMT